MVKDHGKQVVEEYANAVHVVCDPFARVDARRRQEHSLRQVVRLAR